MYTRPTEIHIRVFDYDYKPEWGNNQDPHMKRFAYGMDLYKGSAAALHEWLQKKEDKYMCVITFG